MSIYQDEALMLAAQCWCDDETRDRVMDHQLVEAVAKRIAAWMDTASQFARNAEFYCGLLDECANHLGDDAFTADDGSIFEDPIRLKIPELVRKLVAKTEAIA